jgi:hypothetical protein
MFGTLIFVRLICRYALPFSRTYFLFSRPEDTETFQSDGPRLTVYDISCITLYVRSNKLTHQEGLYCIVEAAATTTFLAHSRPLHNHKFWAPLVSTEPRRLIRSSRPTEIFQPPQQGFFSVLYMPSRSFLEIFFSYSPHTSPHLNSPHT